jgi:hypothetical protein
MLGNTGAQATLGSNNGGGSHCAGRVVVAPQAYGKCCAPADVTYEGAAVTQ